MTDVEQLRRTLIDHEDLAADAPGLVAAVHEGAIRIRRRRRRAYAGVAALAIAAVIAVPVAVTNLHRQVDAAGRAPLALTLDVAPGSGYIRSSYGVTGTAQYIIVRSASPVSPTYAGVTMYDPRTYNASKLLSGTAVTVRGHRAYLATLVTPDPHEGADYPNLVGTPSGLALGWLDGSGAWIVVQDGDSPADLSSVADAVRVDAAVPVNAPYRLTYVPANLPTRVAVMVDGDSVPGEQGSVVSFGDAPVWWPTTLPPSDGTALRIYARPVAGSEWIRPPGSPITIDGYEAWYYTANQAGLVEMPDGGSVLAFIAGDCGVTIAVHDRTQIPLGELTRLIAGARFANCTNLARWVSPLP